MSNKKPTYPPLPEGALAEHLEPGLSLLSIPWRKAQLPEALTEAEQDIVLQVYAGASNDEIASSRGVSEKTVGKQLEAIYRKLEVSSRAELVLRLRGRSRQ